MMKSKAATTGWFFAAIFLVGAILSSAIAIAEGKPAIDALLHPYVFICLGISLLMALSARFSFLIWTQPLVWLASSVLATMGDANNITGLGFFVVAVLLLFRFGFYEKGRALKLGATVLFFIFLEAGSSLYQKATVGDGVSMLFVITVLLVTLYLSYHEKLMVYLHEPKKTLSLGEKGLTDAEQKYVLAMVGGKSPKEIAHFYEVSESTVRNTLARAYKRLGVGDRSELAALAERVQFTD
jgi:DNA-binding CsgD family transcriptional regulator